MTATTDAPALQTEAASPTPPTGISTRRRWLGFSVVLSAMIMNLLDATILNIAAPSVQRDLGATSTQLEWIVAAYTLAVAVGLFTGGRLGDRFGRRPMMLAGLAAFLVTSLACALAWSPETLIIARVLQGLAAAVIVPQSFGLIRDLFPAETIGKAFAAFGPAIGLSTVAGPVVAGGLLELDPWGTDWRSLFLINVPLGLWALIAGAKVLPRRTASNRTVRFDLLGTLLMAVFSVLVVLPLVEGRGLGWPTWIFGLLAAALPVLALFAVQQRRRVRAGLTPLVELSLLAKRSYVSGVVFTLTFFGALVGFSLTLGLFLQVGLGFTPMHAALYLTVNAVGAVVGSGVGAWAATAVGRPILHVGLGVMAAALVLMYGSLRAAEGTVGAIHLLPGMAVYGVGMGMIFVPLFSIIMGEIEDHEVGSASSLLEALQQLGASLGVAVLGTLFFAQIAFEDGGPQVALAAGRHVAAAETTLLVSLGLTAVAFAVGFLLPRRARAQEF